MSEWTSVIAVYWVLWAVDGLKRARVRTFSFVGNDSARARRLIYDRWMLPAALPTSWRLNTTDVPLALSPAGVSNQPIASTGRPPEVPARIQAWRWAELREAGVARGWLYLNGQPFCPDTGHVTAAQLLALARLAEPERERQIQNLIRGWLRPVHLRRRARVLVGRTAGVVSCNLAAFLLTLVISVYVLADIATKLGEERAAVIAGRLPIVVGVVFALHVAAIIIAGRARKRLRRVPPSSRAPGLLSPAMMPPQALRLRALLGENYFPASHPLAVALALGDRSMREQCAFNTIGDLRWPLPARADSALAQEIAAWFAAALQARLTPLLEAAQLSAGKLLQPPAPDSPASRSYCPRCRSQFVTPSGRCPHGIELAPLVRTDGSPR
ncbi:MAG: hypothetical protein Q7S40_16000 [Opitutaceae bacterium]|nr:hypothetical protein [Opitutaceae bacterium]